MTTFGSREERAWAAGFFDGEGNVMASKSHNTMCPIVQMSQCKDGEKILNRFKAAIGGFGSVDLYREAGYLPRHSEMWRFSCTRFDEIETIMGALWPWLCDVKKAQFKETVAKVRTEFVAKTAIGKRQSISRMLGWVKARTLMSS